MLSMFACVFIALFQISTRNIFDFVYDGAPGALAPKLTKLSLSVL